MKSRLHPIEDEFYSANENDKEDDQQTNKTSRNNQQTTIAEQEVDEEVPINKEGNINEPKFRRSTSNFRMPPHRYGEEINIITEELVEPKTYNQAIHFKQNNEWIKAMKNEIKSLIENKTWQLVKLPKNRLQYQYNRLQMDL